MEKVLRANNLPPEIIDKIAFHVHQLNMRPVLYALVHNTVWIRDGDTVSFMIADAPNYYRGLVT